MRRFYAILPAVLLLASPFATAADIRFPVAPAMPVPAPAPAGDVGKLAAEELYVIDSDAPLIVLASPAGLVRITEDTGPLKIRGRFVDGNGKVETRTFKGKYLHTVEAIGTGRVELIVFPVGATKEADVARKTIDVDAGQGPIPPPKPKPEPEPVGPLRVLFIYETNRPLSVAAQNAIFSPAVAKYLDAQCAKDAKGKPEWARLDPNQQFAASFNPTLKDLFASSLAEANKALPSVVVAVGQQAKVYPVTNEVDLLAVLKKHAEGK